MHERQAIENAVIALLLGKTAAGSRVLSRQLAPIAEQLLPLVHVMIDDEVSDPDNVSKAPRELTRRLNVQIEFGVVAAIADVVAAVNALALQIESAMDQDPFLDSNAFTCVYAGSTFEYSTAGARAMGSAILTYAVVYHTQPRPAAASYAALPDFDQSDITIKPPGATSLTVPPVVEGLQTEIHEESTEQVP